MSRAKRIKEGNTVVFDAAKDVLDFRGKKDKVLMEMRFGPISYTTEEGVKFWNKHPFQWVGEDEANYLESLLTPEFRRATKEAVEDYYAD